MGRNWLFPLLLFIWVCGARPAHACSCKGHGASCGPPAEFWHSSAVFSGRVLAVQPVKDKAAGSTQWYRVRMRLTERFSGELPGPGGEVHVFTTSPNLLGYPFKAGKDYFVYAVQNDGRLTTAGCSRTALLDRASADLAYARTAMSGRAPAGRITGGVRMPSDEGGKRLAGIPIVVRGEGTTLSGVTDRQGRYSIDIPAAGTYVIDARLPSTLYTPDVAQRIDLSDPRACVEHNIGARFDGHLTGRVLDSTGRSVSGITVAHIRLARTGGAVRDSRRVLTRDDGTFEMERVPPGPFVLTVDLPTKDGGEDPTRAQDTGTSVTRGALAGGERRSIGALVLPPDVKVALLEGTVHTGTGLPAPGARVFLKSSEPGHIIAAPAVADGRGRFLVAVLEGEHYQIFAEQSPSTTATAAPEFSEPVNVSAARGMPPLRLTVRRRF